MTVREFLKPTRAKWIIVVLFLVGSAVVRYLNVIVFVDVNLGFLERIVAPHHFTNRLGAPGLDVVITPLDLLFMLLGLALALVYWYFLASLIYWAFFRIKK